MHLRNEVVRDGGTLRNQLLALHGRCVKLPEGALCGLVHVHDGSPVAVDVAVVGGGEDRDEVLGVSPLVAVRHDLVPAGDQLEAVGVVELLGHVLPELEAGASRGVAPARGVRRVRPQQVADRPLVRHLLDAVEVPDVVEGRQARGEARMRDEDPVLHHGGQGQVVKGLHEGLPDPRAAVRPHALLVEAVDLRDLPALVVAAKQNHPLRVADLQQEDEGRRLHAAPAAVDVVAEEQVVRVRGRPADIQQLPDVLELAVHVAHDGDWAPHLDAIRLLLQQPPGLLAQGLDLGLREGSARQHVLDLRVEVVPEERRVLGPLQRHAATLGGGVGVSGSGERRDLE
eukprot:CAMPEP_0204599318 /NCGR_PEP_ID=MMETSP0661-20131031/54758_1 /ASSEMBLY_ACC=CAM_ASM_000606 /TAXON_ID=109239 /ORGANISM="Alexandrium margalefi, Strain AMGDE01CS-322" /LENGTH=341 /DNA_ID=CAMNT_0051610033 /DNA_START=99 /DNA_END=1121 /DNA_ORIENTATION=+